MMLQLLTSIATIKPCLQCSAKYSKKSQLQNGLAARFLYMTNATISFITVWIKHYIPQTHTDAAAAVTGIHSIDLYSGTGAKSTTGSIHKLSWLTVTA